MDKQPMCLIHTTGTTLEGEPRYRHFANFDEDKGRVFRETYTLLQPHVHSLYRGMFSAVDRFNKLALGSNDSV